MESMCTRCARITLSRSSANGRSLAVRRQLSTSSSLRQDDESRQPEKAIPGKPLSQAMTGASNVTFARRVLVGAASPKSNGQPPRTLIRKTAVPPGGQVLRRTSQPGPGPILERTGPKPPGMLQRTGPRRQDQGQPQRQGQRQGSRGGKGPPGQGKRSGQPDKRRRKARSDDGDENDSAALEAAADDFINKYVNPPMNPTKPLPYNPQQITLDDLRADWPNTALSTAGMAESVVQKVEYLARRLPHGYMTPEHIAEDFLKGKLVRFESEDEKQQVLKLAAEKTAETKREADQGTLHKHMKPLYPAVQDPTFESLGSKAGDKSHLMQTGVQGDYGTVAKQRYPFLQTVAQALNNNETYGPVQSQKLLDRIQALIPQAKAPASRPGKKA